jgi:uncharacterized YigZ family protein
VTSPVTSYRTIGRPVLVETEVKRSRFLCRLERVEAEEEARAVVEAVRRERWDARHNCSAFVLGPAGEVQRSSDDGEPSGTAGAPMLEMVRGHQVSDVVAVVTRYFGGILLGAGGLVRAYGDAVRAALDEAGICERLLLQLYDVPVPHAEAGRLENGLRHHGITVVGVDYAVQATLHIAAPAEESARLPRLLAELTGGVLEPVATGRAWVDRPAGGASRP